MALRTVSRKRRKKVFGAAYLVVPKMIIRTIIKEPGPRPRPPQGKTGRTKEALHGSLQSLVHLVDSCSCAAIAFRPNLSGRLSFAVAWAAGFLGPVLLRVRNCRSRSPPPL